MGGRLISRLHQRPPLSVRVASLLSALFAAFGLAASGAQARQAGAGQLQVSPNQSGYIASSPDPTNPISFTSVTGTWTVPAASCGAGSPPGGISAMWVGLGDLGPSPSQEEVGTDSNCSTAGKPTYYAWFELAPYISYNVPKNDKIAVGDTMTGLVTILSPTLTLVQIHDANRHWTFSRKITFITPDTATADWMVEAPATCVRFDCAQASLTNFGTFTMTGASAVGNGQTGNLADPDWTITPVQLIPGNVTIPDLGANPAGSGPPGVGHAATPAGATPGGTSPDGSSFAISWQADAKPNV